MVMAYRAETSISASAMIINANSYIEDGKFPVGAQYYWTFEPEGITQFSDTYSYEKYNCNINPRDKETQIVLSLPGFLSQTPQGYIQQTFSFPVTSKSKFIVSTWNQVCFNASKITPSDNFGMLVEIIDTKRSIWQQLIYSGYTNVPLTTEFSPLNFTMTLPPSENLYTIRINFFVSPNIFAVLALDEIQVTKIT